MSDLYFCNLCDQSVPLVELEAGSAVRSGDRVLCGNCRGLVSRVAPSKGGGSGVAGFLAILVGLLGWVAAAVVWYDQDRQRTELAGTVETDVGDLDAKRVTLQAQVAKLEKTSSEERALLGQELSSLREALQRDQEEVSAKLAAMQDSLDSLGQYAAAQEGLLGRVATVEANVSVIEDRQRAHRATQETLRDEIGRVGELARAAATAQPAQVEGESPFSSEITALLAKLRDDDPEVRYGALERLAQLQDERLLPNLYPLLADPYEFTRFLAAHTFGDWHSAPAVPHLITALLDEVGFVREAAVRSLRRITGQNFGYDHESDPARRRQGHDLWQTWWEANGEEFLKES